MIDLQTHKLVKVILHEFTKQVGSCAKQKKCHVLGLINVFDWRGLISF